MIVNTELEQKGNLFPSEIVTYKKDVDTLYFTTKNNVVLQLTVVRDSVIRFRYATAGKFENDFSYGVTIHASRGYSFLDITEDEIHYSITTSKLICKVEKQSLQVRLFDAIDNKLINEDEIGFHWEESYENGGNIVKMSKIAHSGESYYGLGDKADHLNLKGKRFENWVTDSYAYNKGTDPIYKAIPFSLINLETRRKLTLSEGFFSLNLNLLRLTPEPLTKSTFCFLEITFRSKNN